MESWTHPVSDALLTTVALAWAWRRRNDPAAMAGLALIGIAAAFGTMRYAGIDAVRPLHVWVSASAGWMSLPLLAAHRRLGRVPVVAAVIAALVLPALPLPALVQTAVGGLGTVGLVVAFGRRRDWLGIAGALGFPVAALAIGTEGQLGALWRLDLYHLVLSTSVWLLARAVAPQSDAAAQTRLEPA